MQRGTGYGAREYPVSLFVKEHVFLCVLKREASMGIIPLYVSKAYNSPRECRFIFAEKEHRRPDRETYDEVWIAEKPSEVYMGPEPFNIELVYLKQRRNQNRSMDSL